MKKILNKCLILILIVVICGMQNVYAETIITKENLEKSLKEYVCNGKTVTATIDESTITLGPEDVPEEQFEMTDTAIRITLKPEETGFDEDFVIEYNYVIENNQIKFDTTITDTNYTEEQKLLSAVLLPMLYLSVTDLYGVDSEKSLEYFLSVGYDVTGDSVESDVYSLTISDTSFALTVNLDKISIIETENPGSDNENNNNDDNQNNNGNNNGNTNNSNNEENNDTTNRGDVQREDNVAPGRLPDTGTNIGLIVLPVVGLMLLVGAINKTKYKDVK